MKKATIYSLATFSVSLVVVLIVNYALAKMGEPSALWFMKIIGVI